MNNAIPKPQPGILNIAPYVPGDAHVDGANLATKLSSNENPEGPSPRAIEAFCGVSDALALYPSADHAALREALGAAHGIDLAQIICGAGSDEVIAMLCNAYAGPGDEVIHTEHGFAMYRISALAAGATPVEAAETVRHTDVDAILDAVTPQTRLVFIANPNNPTGTMISDAEVTRLADSLPETCLLVLDGAYAEFVPGFDGHADLVKSHDNVVMTRTFSKIYGLGGLRIGWGFAPAHVIDALNRIRGPFNVSAPALAAAQAALLDTDYTDHCRAMNAKWRDWMIVQLNGLGLQTDASHTNFVLPRFSTKTQAEGCDAYLRENGFIVRNVAGYKLPDALRITVGDEIACRRVIQLISIYLDDLA